VITRHGHVTTGCDLSTVRRTSGPVTSLTGTRHDVIILLLRSRKSITLWTVTDYHLTPVTVTALRITADRTTSSVIYLIQYILTDQLLILLILMTLLVD